MVRLFICIYICLFVLLMFIIFYYYYYFYFYYYYFVLFYYCYIIIVYVLLGLVWVGLFYWVGVGWYIVSLSIYINVVVYSLYIFKLLRYIQRFIS